MFAVRPGFEPRQRVTIADQEALLRPGRDQRIGPAFEHQRGARKRRALAVERESGEQACELFSVFDAKQGSELLLCRTERWDFGMRRRAVDTASYDTFVAYGGERRE